MTPQAQVFQTVELLEFILTPLSMRDLIAARLVNFLWNDTISKSQACQRTLYLLPEPSTPDPTPGKILKNTDAGINPLFFQRSIRQAALHALRKVNPKVHFLGVDPFVFANVDAFADSAASWRNMFLFQPPVTKAVFDSMPSKGEGSLHPVENVDGVKIGDLVELFDSLILASITYSKTKINYVDLLSNTVIGETYWAAVTRTCYRMDTSKLP